MVELNVVNEHVFFLHFFVPVGFAFAVADLISDKKVLILEGG
jgi:hypothetical protein